MTSSTSTSVSVAVPCRDCGTTVVGGQRFCPECGARDPAGPAQVPAAPSHAFAADSYQVADVPLPDEPPPADADDAPDLALLPYSKLKQLAATRGLSGKGTKPELIERLSAVA